MLYSRASVVVTYAQNTLRVYVLLADVTYFLQSTKSTYLMSSKKTDFCKKSYIFILDISKPQNSQRTQKDKYLLLKKLRSFACLLMCFSAKDSI
jgi:hypothetical protein